jgi:hypothetical protein
MTTTEIVQALRRRAKATIDRYRQDEAKLYDRRGFPRFPREASTRRALIALARRRRVQCSVGDAARRDYVRGSVCGLTFS